MSILVRILLVYSIECICVSFTFAHMSSKSQNYMKWKTSIKCLTFPSCRFPMLHHSISSISARLLSRISFKIRLIFCFRFFLLLSQHVDCNVLVHFHFFPFSNRRKMLFTLWFHVEMSNLAYSWLINGYFCNFNCEFLF